MINVECWSILRMPRYSGQGGVYPYLQMDKRRVHPSVYSLVHTPSSPLYLDDIKGALGSRGIAIPIYR